MKFAASAILSAFLLSTVVSGWKFSNWFKSKPTIYHEKVDCYNTTIRQTIGALIDHATVQMLDADLSTEMGKFSDAGNRIVYLREQWSKTQQQLDELHQQMKKCLLKNKSASKSICISIYGVFAAELFSEHGEALNNEYPDAYSIVKDNLYKNCGHLED